MGIQIIISICFLSSILFLVNAGMDFPSSIENCEHREFQDFPFNVIKMSAPVSKNPFTIVGNATTNGTNWGNWTWAKNNGY
ncbi:MAG: hypothetical protein ACFFCS_21715, partial [Candidatus Hodarchaeota archaeon]